MSTTATITKDSAITTTSTPKPRYRLNTDKLNSRGLSIEEAVNILRMAGFKPVAPGAKTYAGTAPNGAIRALLAGGTLEYAAVPATLISARFGPGEDGSPAVDVTLALKDGSTFHQGFGKL